MCDIEAAYDSVPHPPLISMVRRLFGQRWANTIQQVLASQALSFAAHNGFSDPVYMGRGLTQGSSLSVLLFLLYTSDGPALPNVLFSRAYVDDITIVLRREHIQATWGVLLKWVQDKGLALAPSKISLVAKSPYKATLPLGTTSVTVSSKQSGRLLGACLHATKTKWCPRNAFIVENCCRVTDAIRAGIYIPTRKKALYFKRYALPKLAIQALSRCCTSETSSKLNVARLSLVPRHTGNGVAPSHFSASSRGYNLPALSTYIDVRKSHARIAARGFDGTDDLPATGFKVQHTKPKRYIPAIIRKVVKDVQSAVASGAVIAATDGGYDPQTDIGSIGISINGKRTGMAIDMKCSSSTQPEIVAQMTLCVATKLAGGVPTGVNWTGFTDSQASLARYKRRHEGDPVRTVLSSSTCPMPQWARGHADNDAINDADAGATEARETTLSCKTCQEEKKCVRCPRISVATIYSIAGVHSYCVHQSGAIQMDTLPQFMKATIQGSADAAVRKKLKGWAPAAAMDGKLLGRLSRIPGAVDLLQAFVRRAIHPLGTTEMCPVAGCNHPLTVEHILLAGDTNHLKHIGLPPNECDTHTLFPRPLRGRPNKILTASAKHIMEAYAHGDREVMQLVASRVRSLTTDPLAKRWATWLLSYLQKPYTY
jgi:hypothetical protein